METVRKEMRGEANMKMHVGEEGEGEGEGREVVTLCFLRKQNKVQCYFSMRLRGCEDCHIDCGDIFRMSGLLPELCRAGYFALGSEDGGE